jgi:predicted Zn-dependent protease
MDTRSRYRKICDKILSMTGKRQAEVLICSRDEALTRFAENVISQNVGSRTEEIGIRLIEGGKVATVTVNREDDRTIKEAVSSAVEILRYQKPDPELLPLQSPKKVRENTGLVDAAVVNMTPAQRAEHIGDLVARCKARKQIACGILTNGVSGTVLANSKGVFLHHAQSNVGYSVTVKDDAAASLAEAYGNRLAEIDFEKVGNEAMEKARMAKNPRAIGPGSYTVVLPPDPVANMLSMMSWELSGMAYNEGSSFACGRLGKKIFSEALTIVDNPLDGKTAGMPFDYEGSPCRKINFVERGVLKAVAHDIKTAKKAGTVSTGHALPQPNSYGAFPRNMEIMPGNSSVERMIKNTKRGLLLCQFHYVNMLRPMELEITGMTRNGLWLIEDGRVVCAVKNLRFTESILNAFSRIEEIGSDTAQCEAALGCFVPAMKIGGFNFSSATKF